MQLYLAAVVVVAAQCSFIISRSMSYRELRSQLLSAPEAVAPVMVLRQRTGAVRQYLLFQPP
jgi:hypothetical protein